MNKLTSKTSYFIVTFFIAAIIASFALTGFEGFNAAPNAVAKVDGTPISIRDYQTALNQKLQMYEKMFGGKPLSQAQIKRFKIQEAVVNELVQRQVLMNKANELGFVASPDEIKEEIKNLPYFQSEGKFDVNKYRQILSANRFSPSSFEEKMKDDLSLKKFLPLLESVSVSDGYVRNVLRLRSFTATINAVQFNRENLTEFLEVPQSKIKEFVNNPENESTLKSLYATHSTEFNRPEQIKARHILLKGEDAKTKLKAQNLRKTLNASNFAKVAGKETQDPSGKGSKGGSLDWFGKGRMVPEFEKVAFSLKAGEISAPVKTQFGYHIIYLEDKRQAVEKKLEDVTEQLAMKHLRKVDRDGLEKFAQDLKKQIKDSLISNNVANLSRLQKKYDLAFVKQGEVNAFDLRVENIMFKEETLAPIFKKRDNNTIIEQNEGNLQVLAKVTGFSSEAEVEKVVESKLKDEKERIAKTLGGQFQNSFIAKLEEESKVVTYPNLL